MGEKWVKHQFSVEIFVCKFERFLNIVNFSLSFYPFLTIFEFEKRDIFDFSNVKKYPQSSRDPPIREILYKLLGMHLIKDILGLPNDVYYPLVPVEYFEGKFPPKRPLTY